MVWLSMKYYAGIEDYYLAFLFQYGLIIYSKSILSNSEVICVSIPIWSDYLSSLGEQKEQMELFLFQYGLIIYLDILEEDLTSLKRFLFQYGLIIYFQSTRWSLVEICVSIPIWSDYLYISTEDYLQQMTSFLFQYGLIIYQEKQVD